MIATCQKCKKERYLYRDNMCSLCLANITKAKKLNARVAWGNERMQKREADVVSGINGSVRSLLDIERDILRAYEKTIESTKEGRKIIDALYVEKAKAKASSNHKNIWK